MSSKNILEKAKIPKPIFLYPLFGIAIVIDILGLIVFILSIAAVGLPISFLLDFIGSGSSFLLYQLQRGSDLIWVSKEIVKTKDSFKVNQKSSNSKKQSNIVSSIISKLQKILLDEKFQSFIKGLIINGITAIIELIPFLGDISPTYTIAVIMLLIRRGDTLNKIAKQINSVREKLSNIKSRIPFRPNIDRDYYEDRKDDM